MAERESLEGGREFADSNSLYNRLILEWMIVLRIDYGENGMSLSTKKNDP